jgi:phage-related baseplate assembly protein
LSDVDKLKNLTDVNFVDTDVETLLSELVADYEAKYLEVTGRSKTLASGDPIRILLYANAARIYGMLQSIDYAAKQNLLKYAAGAYLDQIGTRVGATRLEATAATATVKFTLSAVQPSVITIPRDTRVAAGNVYFATTEAVEIPVGSITQDVTVQCTETGTVGNDFTEGQINVLVDPIPYVATVRNIGTSQGGSNEEDDDSFRERIFLKPESFSVAGPSGAYEYFTKEFNASILDVAIVSPSEGVVDIYLILENGEIPEEDFCSSLENYLSYKTRRPLTDQVNVLAPETVKYTIDLTYYTRKSDSSIETNIKTAVADAVAAYQLWQKSKIGRDIDPGYLQYLIYSAGAKRVVINAPTYQELAITQVARDVAVNVSYGGQEDD